jgi:hypothetical protein
VWRRGSRRFTVGAKGVSGRTETETYGKSATVRDHEAQPTLPRKGLFGRVLDERWRLFNDLCIPFSPIEIRFSGKLPYTTLNMRAERLTVGSISFGKDTCLQVSEIERVPRYRRF